MKLQYRVLVLEDDENALAGIVELLLESGYQVTGSSAYEEAKRLLSGKSYDLFVTDVRVRSYNGLNLVKKLRQDSPDTAVVIMTGYDEPLMQLEASRYNARFIKKPIRAAEFLDAVRGSVAAVRRERRWPRKRVVGGFRVMARASRQRWWMSATAVCACRFPPSTPSPVAVRRRSLRYQPAPGGRAGLVLREDARRASLRRSAGFRFDAGRAHVAADRRSPLGLGPFCSADRPVC